MTVGIKFSTSKNITENYCRYTAFLYLREKSQNKNQTIGRVWMNCWKDRNQNVKPNSRHLHQIIESEAVPCRKLLSIPFSHILYSKKAASPQYTRKFK